MAHYLGLTDNPEKRKQQHGDPPDWQQTAPFPSEEDARAWEKMFVNQPDFQGGPGNGGWRYGYWYTITPQTTQ